MAEPSSQKAPRSNPFWAFRDPLTGRWVTLMTAAQCQQLAVPAFTPRTRRSREPGFGDRSQPEQPDISAG